MTTNEINKAVADGAAMSLSARLTQYLYGLSLMRCETVGELIYLVFGDGMEEASLAIRGNDPSFLDKYENTVVACVDVFPTEFGWGLTVMVCGQTGFTVKPLSRRADGNPDFVLRTADDTLVVGRDDYPFFWAEFSDDKEQLVPHA